MSYKTKLVKEKQAEKTEFKLKALLVMFGNFILHKDGSKRKVNEDDIKEFSKLLEVKK